MQKIPDKSVDLILCDLPYGVTHHKWDTVIDMDALWGQYDRIIKDRGAIVLFSQMPFACNLIDSAKVPFRYEWIYHKTLKTGFLNANRMPLREHENILVFYKKLPKYNPQYGNGKPYKAKTGGKTSCYNDFEIRKTDNDGKRYPGDVLHFCNTDQKNKKHPTEKPVDLLEYLIKTYTDEGDVVLDNTMGAGSTGMACVNTGRKFIGIELDDNYYDIAVDRIRAA
jgi:site-specific DNA-methyltransferase (adenine-specific)